MRSQWTLLELLNETVQYLSRKAIPNPRLDGEVLLASALGCRKIDLYLRYDQPLTSDELDRCREVIRRRSRKEPVAYITGIKEFWSLPLRVNPKVLIPRPETELLVEKALEITRSSLAKAPTPLRILEIGTGCGAIAIALSVELRDGIQITATDLSTPALEVAEANARNLGVEESIEFVEGDLFNHLDSSTRPFFMIISNPPYIPSHEIEHLPLEIKDHEPLVALDGGPDGLALIRGILKQGPKWLCDGGVLIIEIGQKQRPLIEAMLLESHHLKSWNWFSDLHGQDRVLCMERSPRSTGSAVDGDK
jgi:release factor glutamine methyltransferase